jgi:lysozyme
MNTGIDVSSNNGSVDWAQVAQGGFTFAYARATLGKESNDDTFEANRRGARAHGIRFGAYHLPYPGNSSAKQQAQHFLHVASPRPGDLLPAIDIENKTPKDEGEAKFSRDDLVAWFREWLAAVDAKIGAKPIIYTNPSWWSSRLQSADLSGHQLWLAHYTEGKPTIPRPWKTYAIWQHSDRGRIGRHKFDVNRCPNLDAVTIGRAAQSLLVLGAHGPEVIRLKKLLNQWSKAHPPPAHFVENDVFGKNTLAAVRRFQKASGLDDDGKVGTMTWKALQRK